MDRERYTASVSSTRGMSAFPCSSETVMLVYAWDFSLGGRKKSPNSSESKTAVGTSLHTPTKNVTANYEAWTLRNTLLKINDALSHNEKRNTKPTTRHGIRKKRFLKNKKSEQWYHGRSLHRENDVVFLKVSAPLNNDLVWFYSGFRQSVPPISVPHSVSCWHSVEWTYGIFIK